MSNRADITENLEKTSSLLKEIQKKESEVRRLKGIYENLSYNFSYDTKQYNKWKAAYWNYRNSTRELHRLIESLWKISCNYELNFAYTEI